MIGKNSVVTLNYSVVDDKNHPLSNGKETMTYLHGGYGDTFPKLEEALEGKRVGDKVVVSMSPKEAFGEYNEALVTTQPRSDFDDKIFVGEQFVEVLESDFDEDEEITFYIKEITKDSVTLDANHPFAGLNVIFRVEVANIRKATKQEIKEGYAR